LAPFAACVIFMHGYDSSTTAVGHYFEGTVPHFPLYLPPMMITALLLLQSKFRLDCTQCVTFYFVINNISLQFGVKIAKWRRNHIFTICCPLR